MGISLFLWSCEKQDFGSHKKEFIQTVDLQQALLKIENTNNNSKILAKGNTINNINLTFNSKLAGFQNLTNSQQQILVIPAKTKFNNVYSRILAIKINDTIRTVLFNMKSDINSTSKAFTGFVSVTSFSGEFISGFRVEQGKFIRKFVKKKHSSTSFQQKNTNTGDDCDEDLVKDDIFCDNLITEVDLGTVGSNDGVNVVDIYFNSNNPPDLNNNEQETISWIADDAPGGGSTDTQNNPCDEIKNQTAKAGFKDKISNLNGKVNLKQETGFSQNKDGSFNPLSVTNGGHSLTIPIDRQNTIGYIHTHLNDFYTGEIDPATGREKIAYPIRMFSPADIIKFLQIVKHSKYNGIPTSSVYAMMISSTGNYMLRFSGNIDNIPNDLVAENFTEIYKNYFTEDYKNNTEKAFLKFIENEMNVNGIVLAKIEDNGTVSTKRLDSNNTVQSNDCN